MSETRELASKVARWLVQKERPAEAVGVLVAWATHGPNDAAGQALLASALRIDPSAKAAQQAFEKMEGIAGEHAELAAVLQQFNAAALNNLKKEMDSPTFRGAQIGFNNNIRAKNQVFHIQTEDSGLNSPHVITHLFADGGRVIKSFKRNYAAAITTEPEIGTYVRGLMKAQHLEMVFALRNGQFDEILAGKAVGGLEELTEYPDIDLSKLGGRGKSASTGSTADKASQRPNPVVAAEPAVKQPSHVENAAPHAGAPVLLAPQIPSPQSAAPKFAAPKDAAPRSAQVVSSRYSLSPAALASIPPARVPRSIRTAASQKPAAGTQAPARIASKATRAPAPRRPLAVSVPLFALHVLRCLGGGPGRYSVSRRETVIGSAGEITLPGEVFCHPREASLSFDQGRLWLDALEGENGVFLRIHKPVVVQFGEEFLVGDQLLRLEDNPVSDDAPDPAPTYFYSSPRWPSAFRLVQVFEGGARGACLVARGTALQVGSVIGDLILGDDPLVEPQHCVVEEQAGTLILTDLGSKNGVFLRTRARQELINGDEIVIGRTHLVVSIPPPA